MMNYFLKYIYEKIYAPCYLNFVYSARMIPINISRFTRTPLGAFNFILGTFWVLLYIFIRFFRELTDYKIIDLQSDINYFLLFSFLFFIILHFIILFSTFIFWYKSKYKISTSKWTAYISSTFSSILENLFWKPLETLYKTVELQIPFSGSFFFFLESFFLTIQEREKENKNFFTYFFIILFDFAPRLIISIIFFIDVIIFGQIKYFLIFLPLLFLPILFKINLKLMKSFANKNILNIRNTFLEITPIDQERLIYGKFKICSFCYLVVNTNYKGPGSEDPKKTFFDILRLRNIAMQVYLIKKITEEFSSLITITCSLLYFIAGLIRLLLLYNIL